MAAVKVYTMKNCPYCERAKALLSQRGIPYTEELVPFEDEAKWDELEKKTGMKTMPQIFHGERVIGGYSDLAALDGQDKLASLKG